MISNEFIFQILPTPTFYFVLPFVVVFICVLASNTVLPFVMVICIFSLSPKIFQSSAVFPEVEVNSFMQMHFRQMNVKCAEKPR